MSGSRDGARGGPARRQWLTKWRETKTCLTVNRDSYHFTDVGPHAVGGAAQVRARIRFLHVIHVERAVLENLDAEGAANVLIARRGSVYELENGAESECETRKTRKSRTGSV